MARYCGNCGRKLPFFHSSSQCSEGQNAEATATQQRLDRERVLVEESVTQIVTMKPQTIEEIRVPNGLSETIRRQLYDRVYSSFNTGDGLGEDEVGTLHQLVIALGLSWDVVRFEDTVLPYLYAGKISQGLPLPTAPVPPGIQGIVLKRGEVVHFAAYAVLQEHMTVNLGWKSRSQGVSFPIGHTGIRYRVGSSRGHMLKEDRLVTTSAGVLLLTNQRLYLAPMGSTKPLSIPLAKLHSYRCFENALIVFKEGREKGYTFGNLKPSASEIFGLCLSYLASASILGARSNEAPEKAPTATLSTTVRTDRADIVKELEKLTELHDSGALTDQEFHQAKSRLLS
ncbi:MAG: hypothetical protein NVSMB52_17520 [Chloroflexota bacterium]